MISPSQDSTPTPSKLHQSLTEQDVIHEIQSELLLLARLAPDEATESWQKLPMRLGDWSSNLESEISSSLW
ncbi:hypothetical protein [Chroococcidiopsis sp. CCMEE 29]|uniref:hypothetical protein n=1 Tax=Chroococcidiopsis sp. CCMEE 29 TaxID=155894 RepID=UPI002021127D|nr:hypothetical protein [Chroococcidiopsis sp. CCMEE 29]